MNAEKITCDWDEDGLHLVINHDGDEDGSTRIDFRVDDPEALLDAVRSAVAPWIYERDMARATRPMHDEEAYDVTDPKHPRHHEVYADLHDLKEIGV